jgi:phospholipid transport system substrate-binding protein
MKKTITLMILTFLFCMGTPQAGLADETPVSVVETAVNKVLGVLKNDTLSVESRRKALSELAHEFFDFEALSRRTLGIGWKKLNSAEQKEFVTLYADLLEHTYTRKIEDYSDEKVVILGQRSLNSRKAEVNTEVVSGSKSIPITYRMFVLNNVWRVYDVYVEGVSLVKNYRSQFNSILAKNSPREMIEQLRSKVQSFESSN